MPGPFSPGLVRLVASGFISNQERWTNTFHVDIPFSLTQAVADELGDNVTALYNNFEDRCVDYWGLDRVQAYDLSEEDAPSFECDITPVDGTSSGVAFQQIAVVLTWRTGVPGRKFRGRTYLAGISTDQFVQTGDGPLLMNDGTVVGALIAGIEAYHAGMLLDDAIPVIWSRVGAGQKSAITSAGVGSIPDTQRRRRNELEESYEVVNLG